MAKKIHVMCFALTRMCENESISGVTSCIAVKMGGFDRNFPGKMSAAHMHKQERF